MLSSQQIESLAREVPVEERPVPAGRLAGIGSFLGIYGGEHIAATEFVIGALLVTWGVKAPELLLGLLVGNFIAASSYALVTAPIAVDTRMTLFAYLRKVTGPWFQRVYNATWGITSIVWAASMMAISAASLREAFSLPVQLQAYPTSAACVVLTLVLVAVTVFVAAYGFNGVVRFSSLCVPWMIVIFFCGAAVALPVIYSQTGFAPVKSAGDFMNLLSTHVFNGSVPEGGRHLSWMHVAMFAWMCGFVYHVGLNDMSIFRFARRRSYGWVGLFGMYLGHFFAWTCAGVMGAAAAAVLKTDLTRLDPGAVTAAVLGWSGLFAVVVAGWTTATPNIYRAALSFATFFPKWNLRRLSFFVGAVIAVAACFPAVMRIDWIANAAALLVPSVGSICLVEHWIFPRIGFVRHWNLYRGSKINPAALAAWITASLFALAGVVFEWMHPFFLPVPVFALAGLSYIAYAALMGARRSVPEERRRDVDAIEARILALAEEETIEEKKPSAISPLAKLLSHAAIVVLLVLAAFAVATACGAVAVERFRLVAVWYTAAYFVLAGISDFLKRRAA